MCLGYSFILCFNNLYIVFIFVVLVGFSFGIIYFLIFLNISKILDKNLNLFVLLIVSSFMFFG